MLLLHLMCIGSKTRFLPDSFAELPVYGITELSDKLVPFVHSFLPKAYFLKIVHSQLLRKPPQDTKGIKNEHFGLVSREMYEVLYRLSAVFSLAVLGFTPESLNTH